MESITTFDWSQLLPETRGEVLARMDGATRVAFGMTSGVNKAVVRVTTPASTLTRDFLWSTVVGLGYKELFHFFYSELGWYSGWRSPTVHDLILTTIGRGLLGFDVVFVAGCNKKNEFRLDLDGTMRIILDTTDVSFCIGKSASLAVLDYFDQLGFYISQEDYIHGLIAVDAVNYLSKFTTFGGVVETVFEDEEIWESIWFAILGHGAAQCLKFALDRADRLPFTQFILGGPFAWDESVAPPNAEILELLYKQKSSLFDSIVMARLARIPNGSIARWLTTKGVDPVALFGPDLCYPMTLLALLIGEQRGGLLDWIEYVMWPQLDNTGRIASIRHAIKWLANLCDASLKNIKIVMALVNSIPNFPWSEEDHSLLVSCVLNLGPDSVDAKRITRYLFSLDDLVADMHPTNLLFLAGVSDTAVDLMKERPHSEVIAFCRASISYSK